MFCKGQALKNQRSGRFRTSSKATGSPVLHGYTSTRSLERPLRIQPKPTELFTRVPCWLPFGYFFPCFPIFGNRVVLSVVVVVVVLVLVVVVVVVQSLAKIIQEIKIEIQNQQEINRVAVHQAYRR